MKKNIVQGHAFLDDHQFDKSYHAVNRSYKLSWNQKALINHIITWQEATDAEGKPLNLKCFESNATLSEELGIPLKTLEAMISTMNRKYDFFDSKSKPGRGKSRNKGNLNRTVKTVDMKLLAQFLKNEKEQTEANGGLPPVKRKRAIVSREENRLNGAISPSEPIVQAPVLTDFQPQETSIESDPAAPKNKTDGFKMIKRVLGDVDFSGPDLEIIKLRIINEIDKHCIAYKFKDTLVKWIDEYIKIYLLIQQPYQRKRETEAEWQSRKLKEAYEKEETGIKVANLLDGLKGL